MSNPALREDDGRVSIIAATIATLNAEEADGDAVAALLHVAPPLVWPPEYNDAGTREWMRNMIRANPHEPGYGSWYVVGDGRLVGIAGYKGPPDASGEVEIGYSIIEPEQRRGYGGGAIRLLVARALRDPRVSAVTAETIPPLIASQTVLERCGFTLIGRTPNDEVGEILRYAHHRPA